uniref:Uncharacterized protein n=1 Tax=Paramoeba aestuarina TaxID=180227 RepID=A0A7S4NAH4_9EUKA
MTLANVERTFAICLGPTFGWLVGVLVENDLLPEERVYKGVDEDEENEEKKEQKEEDSEEGGEARPSGWAPISPSPSGKSHAPRSASPPLLGGGIGRDADINQDQPLSPPHSPSQFPLQGPETLPSSLSQDTLAGQAGGSPTMEDSESFFSSTSQEKEKDKGGGNLRKSGSGIFRRSKHYQGSKIEDGHEKKRNKISFLGKKTRSGLDPTASRNRKHDSGSLQGQAEQTTPELERSTSAWIVNQPQNRPIMKSTFPHSGEIYASKSSRLWYSMYTAGKYVLEIDAPESVFEFASIEVTVDVVDVEWENLHAERLTSSSPRLRLEFRVQSLEEGEEEGYHGLVIEATLKPLSEESSLPEKISCKGVVSIYPTEGQKDSTTLPFLYDDEFSVAFPVKNNMRIDDITHALTEEKKRIAQLLLLRYGGENAKDNED